MRFATRSLYRNQDVNNLTHSVLRAFFSHEPHTHPLRVKCFSTTSHKHHPSATPQRKVNIFLPHEQLQVNAHLKSTSDTSLIADHYDLDSYLRYTKARQVAAKDIEKRRKLTSSTVFLGTRYEYLIQRHLQDTLGFDLTRVGGTGDGGIDLLGHWSLPTFPSLSDNQPVLKPCFRILIQAKRLTNGRKPMPSLMRELEGTLITASSSRSLQEAFAAHRIRHGLVPGLQAETRQHTDAQGDNEQSQHSSSSSSTPDTDIDIADLPMLGILITTRSLTPGIEKAMSNSRRPLMYIMLEDSSCPPGSPSQTLSTTGSESDISDAESTETSSTSSIIAEHSSESSVPTTIIRQMAWNAAASRAGLEGFDVITKYRSKQVAPIPSSESEEVGDAGPATSTAGEPEAVLAYQGRPVQFAGQVP